MDFRVKNLFLISSSNAWRRASMSFSRYCSASFSYLILRSFSSLATLSLRRFSAASYLAFFSAIFFASSASLFFFCSVGFNLRWLGPLCGDIDLLGLTSSPFFSVVSFMEPETESIESLRSFTSIVNFFGSVLRFSAFSCMLSFSFDLLLTASLCSVFFGLFSTSSVFYFFKASSLCSVFFCYFKVAYLEFSASILTLSFSSSVFVYFFSAAFIVSASSDAFFIPFYSACSWNSI